MKTGSLTDVPKLTAGTLRLAFFMVLAACSWTLADGLEGWPKQEWLEWSRSGELMAMTQDPAGNIILAGNSAAGVKVMKLSGNTGAVLWEVQHDPNPTKVDSVQGVAVDGAGNILIAGSSASIFSGPSEGFTLKFSSSTGALMWNKSENFVVRAMTVDTAGDVILAGERGLDGVTVKRGSTLGAFIWQRDVLNAIPSPSDAARVRLNAVTVAANGDVIVTGRANRHVQLAQYAAGLYVARYAAADGALVWQRREDVTLDNAVVPDQGRCVALDGAGNVIVGGRCLNSFGYGSFFFAKYAGVDGDRQWYRAHLPSGAFLAELTVMDLGPDGNLVAGGYANMMTTEVRSLFIKVRNSDGALLWERQQGDDLAAGYGLPLAVRVHASGDVVVSGASARFSFGGTCTAALSGNSGNVLWQHHFPWPVHNSYGEGTTHAQGLLRLDPNGNAIVAWTGRNDVDSQWRICAQKLSVVSTGGPQLTVKRAGDVLSSGASTVDFGSVETGTSQTLTLTVENTGNADLTFRDVKVNSNDPNRAVDVTGSHAAEIAVGALGQIWLRPGETTSFQLTTSPQATGARSASLSLATLNAGTFTCALTSMGTEPEITVLDGMVELQHQDTVNVGDVMRGTQVERIFTIRNDGTAPLTGLAVESQVDPSAGTLQLVQPGSASLAPGASTTFAIRFTPQVSGACSFPFKIVSNDRSESQFVLLFQLTSRFRSIAVMQQGVPGYVPPSGGTVNLGYVYPSGSVQMLIANEGNSDLTIHSITLSGAHAGDFSIFGPAGNVIGPGQSESFSVHCMPSATGARTATVTIGSDSMPGSVNHGDPFEFAVIANQTTAELEVARYQGAVLANNGATQSFGTVPLGAGIKRDFTLRSTGTATLSGLSVAVLGPNADEVTLTQPGKNTMAPGEETGFSATFSPDALGLRTAILRISSNDMSDDPFDIPISITAAAAGMALVQNATGSAIDAGDVLPFGNILIGQDRMLTFAIRNTGSVDLENITISVEGPHASEVELTGNDFFMVGPGQQSTFDLTWKPFVAGTRTATLRVVSSDSLRSPFLVQLTCNAVPPRPQIDVQYPFGNSLSSGATLDFGTHLVNDEQVETVTIFNLGPADLTSISVSKSGPAAADYTFGLEQNEGGTDKVILSRDENQYLWVAFRPGTDGVRQATLTITSNDEARSPFVLHLNGVGQARLPELAVNEQPAGPNLTSGTVITYPNMEINGRDGPWTEKAFRIRNLGEASLTGISVTKGGTAADEVTFGTYTGSIPTQLAPGAQFTLWVKFWVKTEGPRQAHLSIASNDPTSNPFILNLSTTGLPAPRPAIDVVALPEDVEINNGDTYDFGTVNVGAVGPETKKYFEVTNDGTARLTNIKFWVLGADASEFTVGSDLGPIPPLLALDPGQSVQFWVRLRTVSPGPRDVTVKITSNAPEDSPFFVYLKGNVVVPAAPQLRVDEMPSGTPLTTGSSIDFGEMIPNNGIGVEKVLRVINSGTGVLSGLSVFVAGVHGSDVTIVPVSTPMPTELAAGESWAFRLKFDAALEGVRNAQLHVSSSGAGVNAFQADLRAVGLPSTPVLRVLEMPNQVIRTNGSTLQFDAMVAGADGGVWARRSIRLHNASASTLNGLQISVTGPDAAEVTFGPESSPIPADLGPNEFVDVWIRFDVAAVGERSAVLEVSASSPGVGFYSLNLRSSGAGWSAFAPGLYDGLLHDQVSGELVGSLSTITVNRASASSGLAGVVTGTLRMKGRNAALKGNIQPNGALNATLPQADGSSVVLNLRLEQGNGTLSGGAVRIVGDVTWQGVTATALARKIPYNGTTFKAPTAQRGAFTFLLPSQGSWPAGSPRGEGWMTGSMSASGRMTLVACLGDGTRFTKTCLLSGDGEWALYQELYRSVPIKGRIGGVITHQDTPGVSDADGVFQWIKLSDTREVMHSGGFDLWAQVIGSRFAPPASGLRALSQLADQEFNITFNFVGAGLPQPSGHSIRVGSWKRDDTLVHYGPETLKATINRSTGGMVGSYVDDASGRSVAFTGVAFQKQGLAAGCFVTGNKDGSVIVLPDTTFPYPGSESAGPTSLPEAPATIALPPAVANVSPWLSAASGSFLGLLENAADEVSGALESFTLSATGSFSGALRINHLRYAFSNKFVGATGQVTFNINRKNTTPIAVHLRLVREDGDANGYQVQGTVSIDGLTLDLAAQRLPKYTKTNRSPHEGVYTLALMAPVGTDPYLEPGGHGHATLTVSYLGKCTGTLTLPESTVTSFAGHVSRLGQWSFHRNLYGAVPKGSISGLITFRDEPSLSDLDGRWRWVKLPGALPATSYPSGFDITRRVIGSRYTAPLAGQRAIAGLVDDYDNVWFRISGPDYSTSATLRLFQLDRAITWNRSNRVLYWGPDKLNATFSIATGGISGTYVYKDDFASFSFTGVLLQKQNLVVGKYGSQGKSGSFSIQKRGN